MRPLAEDEFAVRFTDRDLEGLFSKYDPVREGSLDLLFQDGKYERPLESGKQSLGMSLPVPGLRGPKREVVRVRSGELPLEFTLQDLVTADPLFLTWKCAVVLQLQRGSEQLFYTNVMHERQRLTPLDLRALIFRPLRDAAATWFGQWSMERLIANPGLGDLVIAAEEAVRQALLGKGLALLRVDPQNPSYAAWDERSKRVAQGLEEAAKLEGELARKKAVDAVRQASETHDIEEETAKLAAFSKRADLWDRLRQAFNQAEMSKIRSDASLEDFVREADKDRLLKVEDFDRLKRSLAEKREDEERSRAALVRTAELERDYAFKMLELRKRKDLTTSEVEFQQGLERLRLDGEHGMERQRLDFQVERQRKDAEARLAGTTVETAARRVGELEDAKVQAQKQGLDREARRLDEELRLAIRERELGLQRVDQAERQRIDFERRERDLGLELRRRQADLDGHLKRIEREHALETERLTTLGKMPVTSLVAVSDPAKAPLLADLAALEAKKGMSVEQILAMAADKNPQVLGYLERAQTARPTSEEEKRLYERIIGEQKEHANRLGETYRENMDRFERMHGKGLDAVAEVAKALGGGRPPAAAPGSAPHAPPAPDAGAAKRPSASVCPHCHQPAPSTAHFCPNCGGTMKWEV